MLPVRLRCRGLARPVSRLRMLVACLLGTAFAAWLASPTTVAAAEQEPPRVQRTAEPVAPNGPAIRVGGTVVTPDGKPLRGATVILRAKEPTHEPGARFHRDVLAETVT